MRLLVIEDDDTLRESLSKRLEEHGFAVEQAADGKEGFMASRYIKSPIGYRAGFEKVNGRWRIFFFLAGD